MYKRQLELSLGRLPKCNSAARRQRRLQRARWWFDRMREAVDRAGAENEAPSTSTFST